MHRSRPTHFDPPPRSASADEPIAITRAMGLKALRRTSEDERRLLRRCTIYAIIGLVIASFLSPFARGGPYSVPHVFRALGVCAIFLFFWIVLFRLSIVYGSRQCVLRARSFIAGGRARYISELRSVEIRQLGPTGTMIEIRYLVKGEKRRVSCYCKPGTDLSRVREMIDWLTRTRAARAAAG